MWEYYIDYYWVERKRLIDYMKVDDPKLFAKLEKKFLDEIDTEYAKVAPKFTNSKGKVRKEWCTESLRARAEAAGLGKFYPTFYGFASSIHHGDFVGMSAQISGGQFKPELAPSFQAIRDALIMGHQSVIVVISNFNEAAGLGIKAEVQIAADHFVKAWDS